jgi:hypothetical protein
MAEDSSCRVGHRERRIDSPIAARKVMLGSHGHSEQIAFNYFIAVLCSSQLLEDFSQILHHQTQILQKFYTQHRRFSNEDVGDLV